MFTWFCVPPDISKLDAVVPPPPTRTLPSTSKSPLRSTLPEIVVAVVILPVKFPVTFPLNAPENVVAEIIPDAFISPTELIPTPLPPTISGLSPI